MSYVDNMLEQAGQDWTMKSWVDGVTNEYKNVNRTLGAGVTVRAIMTETAKERVTRTVLGKESTVDAQLLVKSDLDVSAIEDSTQEPPVFISPYGLEFDAVAVGREAQPILGMVRIFLLKRRAKP